MLLRIITFVCTLWHGLLLIVFDIALAIYPVWHSFIVTKKIAGWWGWGFNWVLFPITSVIAPFYTGFTDHNWKPAIIIVFLIFGGVWLHVQMAKISRVSCE